VSEEMTTGSTKANKGNGAEKHAEALNASNVFDNLDSIRRPSPTDLLDEKQVDVHLPVRKPKPREHFRICDDPSMSMNLTVYIHKPEGSMDEETFFVMPNMETHLREQEELRIVQIVLCRTLSGALFLWPLPVHDGDGPARSHITSARSIAREALAKWVRMKWRRSDNAYFMLVAEDAQTEPQWPDKPFSELLKLAFKDKVIDSRDHPVMKELRGIKASKTETSPGAWLS
jgi:hypothetical protein